jgi:hypothetical protein
MTQTKEYRQLKQQVKDCGKQIERASLYKMLNGIHKEYRLDEYSLHEDVKEMQHHFKNNIDAFTAQKIATRVWESFNDLIFGNCIVNRQMLESTNISK